jgi:hypothetical protein
VNADLGDNGLKSGLEAPLGLIGKFTSGQSLRIDKMNVLFKGACGVLGLFSLTNAFGVSWLLLLINLR